jgi:hypothetical protein
LVDGRLDVEWVDAGYAKPSRYIVKTVYAGLKGQQLLFVTHSVAVRIVDARAVTISRELPTWSAANIAIVVHISIAIAIAQSTGFAPTTLQAAGTIADPAFIDDACAFDARIVRNSVSIQIIVANAVAVNIRGTTAAAYAHYIFDVSLAITRSRRNAIAIANSTLVLNAHAIIHVVADQITVDIRCTGAVTNVNRIVSLRALTIAITHRNACSIALPAFIDDTVAGRTRVVAVVIANAVFIHIHGTVAPAVENCVLHVTVAIARTSGNAIAAADAAFIYGVVRVVRAGVDVIAHAVVIGVAEASSTAHVEAVLHDARVEAQQSGRGVVVTRGGYGAANDLFFVADIVSGRTCDGIGDVNCVPIRVIWQGVVFARSIAISAQDFPRGAITSAIAQPHRRIGGIEVKRSTTAN